MNAYNSNGTITAEDLRHRHIARNRVLQALQQEQIQIRKLVDHVVSQITLYGLRNRSISGIWKLISNHATLTHHKLIIDANTADYPSLLQFVAPARTTFLAIQRQRLEHALQPIVDQKRFALTLWK